MKRLVRRLLRLFPDAFRKRYGDELAEFLELRAADIGKSTGTFGVARFWIINTFDLVRTAIAERSDERRQRPPLRKGDGFMNSRLGIRQALHSFRHRRAFAAVAVASIGIGIGANLAVLGVASSVLLDALPYENPQELVMVWGRMEQTGLSRRLVSPANYHDFEQQNGVFEAMGAYTEQFFNLAPDDRNGSAQRLGGVLANPGFLKALGVQPIVGRALRAEDALRASGEGPLAILVSHRVWTSRFGSDDRVQGTRITLSGRNAEVVGVLPPGFFFLDNDMDVLAPLSLSQEQLTNWRRRRFLTVVARLKDGVKLDEARAEMELIFARLADTYPDVNEGRTVELLTLDGETRGSAWPVIALLQGASLFVLLIAAANVSSFQITGLLSRSREFSTRAALGATRRQLVQQVLNESLLLGAMGGALGVALAATSARILTAAIPIGIPGIESAGVDARVLVGACVLTAVASMAAGALPAVYASNFDLRTSLRGGGHESASRSRRRAQELLVAVGVAVAFMLLLATGLAVKSLMLIQRVDPGFTARSETVAMDLSLDRRYTGRRAQFFESLLDRVQAQPRVRSAGVTTHLPFSRESGERRYSLVTDSSLFEDEKPSAEYRRVSERYFDAMGMTLRRGRGFSPLDMQETSTSVVIINTALAERHWPGEDPIGRRLMIDHGPMIDDGSTVEREIVGVVANVRHFGRERAPRPELYIPHVDRPWPHMTLVVRATGASAGSLVEQVRAELGKLDRAVPVSNVRTLDDYISASSGARRFSRNLLGGYGAVALLLSSLGIFGIVAHTVGQRKREFAIRTAVGAQERDVLALVLRDGVRVIGFGLAAGAVGAAMLAPLAADMVYGVELFDIGVASVAFSLMAATALLACYIPARRTTKMDLVESLRP